MTIIAWDGKTLAADKQATSGGYTYRTKKIYRVKDGLAAFSGHADTGRAMLEWYKNGAVINEFPKYQDDKEIWSPLTIFKKNGIFRYERTPHPIKVLEKKYAFGSGRDYAIAAMYCGKTAKEAVLIASKFDENCGLGVDSLEL